MPITNASQSCASRSVLATIFLVILLTACGGSGPTDEEQAAADNANAAMIALGEKLYFDTNLSTPAGQSCASCHTPASGFDDPDSGVPVSEGVIGGRFGNRNSPTTSYAAFVPSFALRPAPGGGNRFTGGQFWDGRASTLEDQAQAPFLNPLEMNNPDKASVVDKVKLATYATEFRTVFGATSLDNVDSAYLNIAQAIAAFERSSTFSPFSSKFDAVQRGVAFFSAAELRGFLLFNGKGQCERCHSTASGPQVFSDFAYHNIGVPANPDNPFLLLDASLNPDGLLFVDLGLGAVLGNALHNGKFRTPNLRNIALTAPYMHNGIFDTLEQVIQFYNRRDVDAVVPEVNQNIDDAGNIGELGLTNSEVQDLIAFLQTLSDGFF